MMLEGMGLGTDMGSWWQIQRLDSGCIFEEIGCGLVRLHGLAMDNEMRFSFGWDGLGK